MTIQRAIIEKVDESKLMYALNYDAQGKFYKIFKLANNDQFRKLTCQDIALIENRMEKNRDHKPAEIKSIIQNLLEESAKELKKDIDNLFGGKNDIKKRDN